MQVFSDPEEWLQWRGKKRSLLTIGNFDGVHLGHRQLLKCIIDESREQSNSVSVLLSFFPHPVQVLKPERKHTRLFDLKDQQEQLEALGLQAILRQPFSRQFSELTANEFLQDYILKYFHPSMIVVGHDFSFGAYRKGNRETLATK
jgi:riboflavin kinase/FMN adenylyltransferase